MRFRLSTPDGALLIGILLLISSATGLLLNSVMAQAPEEDDRRVVVRVDPPTVAAAQVQPTWTPFQPYGPTATAEATAPPVVDSVPTGEGLFLAPLEAEATPTPERTPLIPDRLVIPSIYVDAPIVPSGYRLIDYYGQVYQQWEAPTDYAAGWQLSSPGLGVPGNTVLNGHHNVYGAVFGSLVNLYEGDIIQIYAGNDLVQYEVANKMILPEEGMDLNTRLENAQWLQPTDDERLTLVTCWPPDGNSHRLIIVARPIQP